ncbi:ribosome quality control complex subunit TCF25-like [Glandiceps talaboti]
MSSRALRKLHGIQDSLPTVDLERESSSDEEPELVDRPSKTPFANPFLALTEDNEESTHQDEMDKEEVEVQQSDEVKPIKNEHTGARKKKKKKKKKKEQKEMNKTPVHDEDEIDASIREVNVLLGEIPRNDDSELSNYPVAMDTKAVLWVEHKHLNPDNEMRRIFGSQIVRTEGRRRGQGSRHHRTTWLVTPKSTWPPLAKSGLSMKYISKVKGCECFTFEHSKDYQQVQFKFLDAVESLNPNNIVEILNMHPYHIDSLIQLSEVCKMSEDIQMATELIERALFCFECNFHVLFNLTQSSCRLDYRRQENRAFFLALFKHLMFVGQRGCYRTSLEYCKLLLSLDADHDPLCVLLMIDFYAIRSKQYEFLIRLYNEWESQRNLSQLPNFAFSVALAKFHLGQENADAMLQDALLKFPSILQPLLDKCSIQPDQTVSKHSFYTSAPLSQPAGLQHLVSLYIGRSFSVWKEPEVVTWLESNVLKVLQRVDDKDPLVEQYAKKRHLRYQGTPTNILRHIMLSEIQDANVTLPAELAQSPMMSYDPLPPDDNIVSYTRPPRSRLATHPDNGPLAAFFRSLLPTYNLRGAGEGDRAVVAVNNDEQEGAVGGPAGLAATPDLGRSIETLMDAMRNLLSTLNPQQQNENEQDEEQNEEN